MRYDCGRPPPTPPSCRFFVLCRSNANLLFTLPARLRRVPAKHCKEPGCNTQPTFGTTATGAQYCSAHRRKGDRDVVNKTCQAAGCPKHPSFAPRGQAALRCKTHSIRGDINVRNKRCVVKGCEKQPSYGPPPVAGRPRKRHHCSSHAIATDVYNATRSYKGFGLPAPRFRGGSRRGSRKRSSVTVG